MNGDGPRAGDFVLARPVSRDGWLPAGRVERVLPSRQGDRLLIERAFGRGTYLVARAAEVVDVEALGVVGARWLYLSATLPALYAGGVFGRATGYLTRLPFIPAPPAPPDDGHALRALQAAVGDDPLTAHGDLALSVTHGVAVLTGWVHDAGSKVQAERLARTTPGVWAAVNTLIGDEAVGVLARRALLENAEVRPHVVALSCDLGRVTVRLSGGGESHASRVQTLLRALPGVRAVDARVEHGASTVTGDGA